MPKPLCILVLGTPRSGTSCIAGIVHHLGVPMGTRLMEADEWNPAGYFQDEDFEDILHEALGGWVFPDWATSTPNLNGKYARRIKQLAETRAASGEIWGVKSNRLIFFLSALKAGAENLLVIRTSRPLQHSIASWLERAGDAPTVKVPIECMAHAIENGLKQCGIVPALTVEFDTLIDQPQATVQQIATAIGFPLTQAAVDFVDPKLRRFTDG